VPRLRRLSGDEVLSIWMRFGFRISSQRGSHAKLRRHIASGARQTLTVVDAMIRLEKALRPHIDKLPG
jgi:predicted RNA binding protein YcfA (HicA-like mRNA interferase family)